MLSRWTRALGLALSIWLLAQSPASAVSIKILVQSSPLAGSQYYSANRVWGEIRIGDRLSLAREQDNRHDRNAVRVEWNGQKLGYVPRAENRAVAHARRGRAVGSARCRTARRPRPLAQDRVRDLPRPVIMILW